MPLYKLKGGDGQWYEVDGPSEAEANEALQRATWRGKGSEPSGGADRAPQGRESSRKPLLTDKQRAESALQDSGPLDKLAINLGAGIDSTFQGVKGLFERDSPERDARVEEKRSRDRALADETSGGGLIQTLGEILPTLAIPAGGFAKTAELGGRGVAAGARALFGLEQGGARAAAGAGRMTTGRAVADSALAGGATGATQLRTSRDNAAFDMIVGAGLGAAVPGLLASGKRVWQLVSEGGANGRAAAKLIDVMGGEKEAQAALDEMANYKPHVFAKDVPMTPAEITQSPGLRVAENAAQARNTADWVPFRESQAQARYKAVREATSDAEDLASHMQARDDVTGPIRERALGRAEKDPFFTAPVAETLADMAKGDLRSNPAARSVMRYVGGELDQGITPGQLYTVRKTLTEKLNGKVQLTDELGQSVKASSAATMQLVKAIDEGLDQASKGQWSKYLKKYQGASGEVNNARAAEKLRDLIDEMPVYGRQGQEVPALTSDRMRKAVTKLGPDEFGGNNFNFGTEDALKGISENLDRTFNLGKTVRSTGTGGGGSNTRMDSEAVEKIFDDRLRKVVPFIGDALDHGVQLEKKVIDEALRNPDRFIEVVSRKLREKKPLSTSEALMLDAIRAGNLALPAAVL